MGRISSPCRHAGTGRNRLSAAAAFNRRNMEKIFNTAGTCFPDRHYMVNLTEKLEQIAQMVDNGRYFCINRARQYGKSTILHGLAKMLSKKYIVFSLSFQRMSTAKFRDEDTFCRAFINRIKQSSDAANLPESSRAYLEQLFHRLADDTRPLDLTDMFDCISEFCVHSPVPAVLIIDEVDNACSNQIFVDFLGQLRDLYLNRETAAAFQSVILAGVYNVKNLKLKIGSDAGQRYNSPWNIADDFTIDIGFQADEIKGMLLEYEAVHHTGMDADAVSRLIFDYTDGYPYMVSRICKLTDERVAGAEAHPHKKDAWTKSGILEAVRILTKESNTLFDDMIKKLDEYPELRNTIYHILFHGIPYPFEIDNPTINIGCMFGFIKEEQNFAVVANRIFEIKLYNLFLSEQHDDIRLSSTEIKSQFFVGGMLQMDLVMKKFYEYFQEICQNSSDKFIEDEGRRIFLMFLRPIINGAGNYYVEARTRDRTRTDIVVDYKGTQFIIELKIWHGDSYLRRGRRQLFDYLDLYQQKRGYLLSFNFNKNKKTGISEINYEGKWIMEIVV